MFDFFRRLLGEPAPQPIPDALWDDVFAGIVWFDDLTEGERARLREFAARFLATKKFVGAGGLQVTPAMALTIAMLASWPVLHLGFRELGGWTSVIVYPGGFRAQRRDECDETGVISEYTEDLVGEAWEKGPLIVSWSEIEEDLANPDDGTCVVLHEVAHKLDARSGEINGAPALPPAIPFEHWLAVLQQAFEALGDLVEADREDESLVDPYAATAPEEFFAVCSEYFFVRPDLLEEQFPDFARLLRLYYLPHSVSGSTRPSS
ncbi:MAG: zinc-dependent peptidase [Sandaracinaceae bacterium]|jgi:Mlc titration factor MtfA (ptsG expression regulator)|nr:zinc-dependent peptidase [Sandaracinaceae bacterium]MBP7681984.1 zinc-dependent peptidase [Deltaproteobacteria bacterium]MBK6813475.1 zinc-dependent peptidase [Sandaracinaceae bacterium]MBK7152951.1 zinc-dependent peptidase [Sandaracinaceae bacterium]MBK7773606.1 zinc-dependent peptidase [Sandaracinaceae bacterium]